MNVSQIVSQIESEISHLQQVRDLLVGGRTHSSEKRGRRPAKKRTLSAEARARIAEAQRKRWAKQKAAK